MTWNRAAGLILLGLGVLVIAEATRVLVNAVSDGDELGTELAAFGQVLAAFYGIVGLLFLVAAVGVLRRTRWGRWLGLILSFLIGVLGSVLVLLSKTGTWDPALVPIGGCLIAFVALVRAGRVPEGI